MASRRSVRCTSGRAADHEGRRVPGGRRAEDRVPGGERRAGRDAGDGEARARRDRGTRLPAERVGPAAAHRAAPPRSGSSPAAGPTRTTRPSTGGWRTSRGSTGTCCTPAPRTATPRARGAARARDVRPAGGRADHHSRRRARTTTWCPRSRRAWPPCSCCAPPELVRADAVLPDERGGARAAVAHLIAHGHRRIGFVGGPGRLPARGAAGRVRAGDGGGRAAGRSRPGRRSTPRRWPARRR